MASPVLGKLPTAGGGQKTVNAIAYDYPNYRRIMDGLRNAMPSCIGDNEWNLYLKSGTSFNDQIAAKLPCPDRNTYAMNTIPADAAHVLFTNLWPGLRLSRLDYWEKTKGLVTLWISTDAVLSGPSLGSSAPVIGTAYGVMSFLPRPPA